MVDPPPTSERLDTERFALSYSRPLLVLLTPLLAGPKHSSVTAGPDEVVVGMGLGGWAFRARVPRSSVTAVEPMDGSVVSRGAHGWRHQWLVNASSRGLVRLTIEPRVRGRCLVFPISIGELVVSLDDPDAFVRAV